MQIEYIAIVVITIIANAVFEFLGYGMSKVVVKISISPLRKFWKPFLRDGGIIVIPPYPKNRSDFSVKNGTGYNDCIASGEIRKFLALMGIDIEVKEKINDTDRGNNLIIIGGPISNPAFKEAKREIDSPIVFEDHGICVGGREYPCDEDNYGYGLLYLCKNLWNENQMIILIAGRHGPDTRKLAEMLTNKNYIKLINRRIKERKCVSTIFILKYRKMGDTPPEEIVENEKGLQLVRNQ